MGLFLSTFINKVDAKGRVSVPAPFRAALAQESFQGVIAFRSYKFSAVECCSYTRMELLSKSLDNLDMFSDEQDDLTATIFADALQLPFDGDGRIILPKKLADFANISDRAAFVGRGATFQIWSPEDFDRIQNEARTRTKDRQSTVRLTKSDEGA
jgi:MraZ protein